MHIHTYTNIYIYIYINIHFYVYFYVYTCIYTHARINHSLQGTASSMSAIVVATAALRGAENSDFSSSWDKINGQNLDGLDLNMVDNMVVFRIFHNGIFLGFIHNG